MNEENKIRISNWNINYLKVGSGPHTVFCMPGTFGTIWTNFKHQVEGFDREQFTLVAWDPPGYGKSRPPVRDGFPVDVFENDADLAYEFMKAVGKEKFSMLGWCGGGRSAIILAAKHPECAHKLVVWATNSFFLPKELDMFKAKAWRDNMKDQDPMVAMYGADLVRYYHALWVDGLDKLFDARGGDVCSEFLKDVRCPTLVLYGERDARVDRGHVDFLHSRIKDSRVHLYPDGGHSIHKTHAQDFNTRVQEFLLEP